MTAKPLILLVDDEPDLCVLVDRILSRRGFAVDIAYDGREALKKIEKGHYDLILTDLMMPEVSGVTLVETVRQWGNDIPIVVMTGFHAETYRDQALAAGANDYIVKPFSLADLVGKLRKLAQSRG